MSYEQTRNMVRDRLEQAFPPGRGPNVHIVDMQFTHNSTYIGVCWTDGPAEAGIQRRLPPTWIDIVLRRTYTVDAVLFDAVRYPRPVAGSWPYHDSLADPWVVPITPASQRGRDCVERLKESRQVRDVLGLHGILLDEFGDVDTDAAARRLRAAAVEALTSSVRNTYWD